MYELLQNLSEKERENIQAQLWALMEEQVRRYTMGDSSSVTEEVANELLDSIYFCLGLYFKSCPQDMGGVNIKECLAKGRGIVMAEIERGRSLYELCAASEIPVNVHVYKEAMPEIMNFFINYDVTLMAHNVPCMIDYQLLNPVGSLMGIEYINEYLLRFAVENQFLNKFNPVAIERLLNYFSPCYEEEIANIPEIMLPTLLSLEIAGEDFTGLIFSKKSAEKFLGKISPPGQDGLISLSLSALNRIFSSLGLDTAEYFIPAAKGAAVRLMDINTENMANMIHIG